MRSAIRGDYDPMSREVDQSDEGAILAPPENFGQMGSGPAVNERPLGGDPPMDDANTASDNSILTPEESDLPSRRLGSGPTTYYDSEEVEGERQRTMEILRRDVINMVEEARLENRLAMEENKAMLENNVASIEDKLGKDRAMAEVERSERDRTNTAMMEDLRY